MWIQNVSMADIVKGNHNLPDKRTVLIQIQDFGTWQFALPKYKDDFVAIHQFRFDDIEDDNGTAIQDDQAAQLVEILQRAQADGHNVIVHCHAGICRSGAVCEIGVMMGFDEPERHRIPNLLVKRKIMRVLGWGYSDDEVRSDDPSRWDEWANKI
jgi:predicted protein tyrosine phosphatase